MKRLFIFISLVALIFFSCEKEIQVDVEDAPQQLVIEGVLNNYMGESYFLISKSVTLYGGINFEKVSGASVIVEDDSGTMFTFSEDPATPGRYILPSFQGQPNTVYNMTIVTEGETITASSWAPSVPKIDTLDYIINPPGFGSEDSTYFLFYTFTDDASQENFYRFKPIVNNKTDNNFYIGNDELGNGETTTAPLFATEIVVGDSNYVKVILQSFDEANYKYLFSWANAADQSPFSAAPGNPVTNLEGSDNVVGYFGAFMQDTMVLELP